MSYVNGKLIKYWIEENHPENGIWRVYWKDVKNDFDGDITVDPEEGEGLRFEWEYKDGKQVGTSKGWWPNGNLKSVFHYKDGKKDGLETYWYQNGKKDWEKSWKDGKPEGSWTWWYENGQKLQENTYKDHKEKGKWTYWYENGQKMKEEIYSHGTKASVKEWNEDGSKKNLSTYKNYNWEVFKLRNKVPGND